MSSSFTSSPCLSAKAFRSSRPVVATCRLNYFHPRSFRMESCGCIMPCVDNRKRADSIDKFFRILQSSPLFELYLVNLVNPVYDESSRLGGLQFLRGFVFRRFLIRRP